MLNSFLDGPVRVHQQQRKAEQSTGNRGKIEQRRPGKPIARIAKYFNSLLPFKTPPLFYF